MRIGIDARPLAPVRTGIGNYIYCIVRELYTIDGENEYFCYSNKPFELPFEENERWHKCIHPGRISTRWYCLNLPGILNKDGIDVFWGTQHVLPFGNRHIAHVLTVHDLAMYYFPHVAHWKNYLVNRALLPYSARKASRIIAVSASTKKDVVSLLGVDAVRVEVIHEAADDTFRPQDPEEALYRMSAKYGLKGPYVLYLGTLEPRKNITVLLHAYAWCIQRNSIRHRLVIAGRKGWKYKEIFELVDKLYLGDHTDFLGYVEGADLTDLYSAASLFVFPSLYEGFGLPVLEAMRCGTPVITTSISSLPEVAGDAALYIDPRDPGQLAETMEAVLSDDILRKELRERGLEQSEKFCWTEAAQKTHKLITGKEWFP